MVVQDLQVTFYIKVDGNIRTLVEGYMARGMPHQRCVAEGNKHPTLPPATRTARSTNFIMSAATQLGNQPPGRYLYRSLEPLKLGQNV